MWKAINLFLSLFHSQICSQFIMWTICFTSLVFWPRSWVLSLLSWWLNHAVTCFEPLSLPFTFGCQSSIIPSLTYAPMWNSAEEKGIINIGSISIIEIIGLDFQNFALNTHHIVSANRVFRDTLVVILYCLSSFLMFWMIMMFLKSITCWCHPK